MSAPRCSYCGEPFVTLQQPCMNPDCPTRQPVGALEVSRSDAAPDVQWLMRAPLHQIIGSHTACAALQSELRAQAFLLESIRAVLERKQSERKRRAQMRGVTRAALQELWVLDRANGFDHVETLLKERGASPTARETAR